MVIHRTVSTKTIAMYALLDDAVGTESIESRMSRLRLFLSPALALAVLGEELQRRLAEGPTTTEYRVTDWKDGHAVIEECDPLPVGKEFRTFLIPSAQQRAWDIVAVFEEGPAGIPAWPWGATLFEVEETMEALEPAAGVKAPEQPGPVSAYRVLHTNKQELQDRLQVLVEEGWKVVSLHPYIIETCPFFTVLVARY